MKKIPSNRIKYENTFPLLLFKWNFEMFNDFMAKIFFGYINVTPSLIKKLYDHLKYIQKTNFVEHPFSLSSYQLSIRSIFYAGNIHSLIQLMLVNPRHCQA